MTKILFLASWYPSSVDPFNGDFIERHAICISLSNQVYVIYVVKDPSIRDGKWLIDKKESANLVTYVGYYLPKWKNRFLEKITSSFYYHRLQRKIFKLIRSEYGMPDIVHLNVMMKAGLFALWLKRKYKLPYVVSEHWTGYSEERKDNYFRKDPWFKYFSKIIFRNCDCALPVTKELGKKITQLFGEKKITVIPNVVDTALFHSNSPIEKESSIEKDRFKFIHVSSLGYHKNIWGILHTLERLFEKRKDFEIHLVGPAPNELIEWAKKRRLNDTCVFFKGILSYEEVAMNMQKSDSLVMFSRYENLPCVILEALCCGLPVISTDVGGIKEVINNENGILIPSENEKELIKAMEFMIINRNRFDRKKIALDAQNKYNYFTVGKQFNDIYRTTLELQSEEVDS